jgi:shikimate dehydrogenase
MQNAALRSAGLEGWRYSLLPVPPELFDETVAALAKSGFVGVNVTVPHKEAALRLADSAGEAARAIGAANTLIFGAGGEVRAENTDAPGMIAALPSPVRGLRALVLGAGGSGRAAAWALRQAGAAEVLVWNRTPQRARQLAAALGGKAVAEAVAADMLVNCTTAGLDPEEPPLKGLPLEVDELAGYKLVVDFVYRPASPTPLSQAARRQGCEVVDGLELLVRQGALSFTLFTGREAPLAEMREAVREG